MAEGPERFYRQVLKILTKTDIPFLIGGTFAVRHYTGIERPTKDIDIFCKASDSPKILKIFTDRKFPTTVWDVRWLAKIFGKTSRKNIADLVFGSIQGTWQVNDGWFQWSQPAKILGLDLRVPSVSDLIISRIYRVEREKFEGPDIAHLILKQSKNIDWKYLLSTLERNWEILLIHLILFRYIYPSERNLVPEWVMKELASRLEQQFGTNPPQNRVTRGSIISTTDYRIDIEKWGYKDITH
ncbi:hypothetical protein M1403_03630 [Patescibacteria group bacterium]|nr:hypothetical protein [Patescibacteria group bacterium]